MGRARRGHLLARERESRLRTVNKWQETFLERRIPRSVRDAAFLHTRSRCTSIFPTLSEVRGRTQNNFNVVAFTIEILFSVTLFLNAGEDTEQKKMSHVKATLPGETHNVTRSQWYLQEPFNSVARMKGKKGRR